MRSTRLARMAAVLIAASGGAAIAYTTTFTNFDAAGKQVVRFDTKGDAVDAHDGKLAFFNGRYYLYGTSYNCGYQWGVGGAPCCGFRSYSSRDLVHWTDGGPLFDAGTAAWQTRCNGSTYGCYRPHVIYNATSKLYVLWINVYDNRCGFRVFTSASPSGPFAEAPVPTLAVNNDAPVAGLNNGDHDLFVDDDGAAYIAYTDWRTNGRIAIERLTADYLSGSGSHVEAVTSGATEAPALFKRRGTYYLTYSDPNCGYCSGTGTSYRTATSPLGTWSEGKKISENSCGGQPSFVSRLLLANDTAFMYGSDLWNDAEKNEALANFYWAPLAFAADGAINPIECRKTVTLDLAAGAADSQAAIPDLDANSGADGFLTTWDIGGKYQRSQAFVPTRSGKLATVAVTSFQHGNPNAPLQVEVYQANASMQPTGAALSTASIPVDSIGWSPRNITVKPNINVTAGARYAMVIKSATTSGSYGAAYSDSAPYPGGGAAYSDNAGAGFAAEKGRTLKFYTTIAGGTTSLPGLASPAFGALPGVEVVAGPSSGSVRFALPAGKVCRVRLLDVGGRVVAEGPGPGKRVFAFASPRAGVYLAQITVGGKTTATKICLY